MWVEIKREQDLAGAEKWKEVIEGEGIPTRILPVSGGAPGQEPAAYMVLVPGDKEHLIEEVLRKL